MSEASDQLTPMLPPDDFHGVLEAAQLALEPAELEALGMYLSLLVDANTRMNLTRLTDPYEAWHRHVFDALTLLPFIEATGAANLLDLGSGGGIPGLVLAIARRDLPVTLLEATLKKARFLQHVVDVLELDNVTVISERAETFGSPEGGGRDGWDVVTARAVAPMAVLLELALPLATPEGFLLAIKGERAPDELEAAHGALRVLKASVETTLRTPTGTIVLVRRDGLIPKRFPRRPGEPKANPLGGA